MNVENEREYYRRHGIMRAIWAIDSETREELLLDLDTNKVIAKRVAGKIVDPGEKVNEVKKD